MKDNYIFVALLNYADDGITVLFPDLPGCITCGNDDEEAFKNATEVLGLHLWGMEKDADDIPEPTAIKNIKLEDEQEKILVSVHMPVVSDRLNNKAVKVTLTIPQWMKTKAEHEKISFSQCLQDALKEKLCG